MKTLTPNEEYELISALKMARYEIHSANFHQLHEEGSREYAVEQYLNKALRILEIDYDKKGEIFDAGEPTM